MRSVRLWSPCLPLEAFASGLAQLLSRENRLQVRGRGRLGSQQQVAPHRHGCCCAPWLAAVHPPSLPPGLPPAALQSFSYVSTDASVSRLLGELQGLTSLQLLDILSPAFGSGQGLVVKARELAK